MRNWLVKLSISCTLALFLYTGITATVHSPAYTILPELSVGFAEVQARATRGEVRRVARRTTRRVNRRHSYYHALPRGCTQVFFNGRLHHYCNGIYYLPQIDQNETTYVIVNP
jgi:hypothetical protein